MRHRSVPRDLKTDGQTATTGIRALASVLLVLHCSHSRPRGVLAESHPPAGHKSARGRECRSILGIQFGRVRLTPLAPTPQFALPILSLLASRIQSARLPLGGRAHSAKKTARVRRRVEEHFAGDAFNRSITRIFRYRGSVIF